MPHFLNGIGTLVIQDQVQFQEPLADHGQFAELQGVNGQFLFLAS